MATDYTLSLKAVLDTTEVQDKLNQLKEQQQSQGGVGSSIPQALQRLNSSITSLQRSIDKLSGALGKDGVGGSSHASSTIPFAAASRQVVSNPKASPSTTSPWKPVTDAFKELRQVNTAIRQTLSRAGVSTKIAGNVIKEGYKVSEEFRRFQRTGMNAGDFYKRINAHQLMSKPAADFIRKVGTQLTPKMYGLNARGLPDITPATYSFANWQKQINAARRAQIANNPLLNREKMVGTGGMAPGMSTMQRAQMKNLGRLAFGVVAGGAQNYFEATGNQGAATVAGFASNIGMGAAMGGMMGGPVGAGIGAAAGLLTSAFEELTRRAKEAASALEQQGKAVMQGQQVDNKLYDYFQSRNDQKALEKNNYAYFQKQFKEADDKYKRVEAKLKEEVGLGGEGLERFNLREYAKQTQEMMKARGANDAEVKRRQNVEKVYAANADVLMEAGQRRDEMKQAMLQIKPLGKQIKDWFDPETIGVKSKSHYYDEFGVRHDKEEKYTDQEWWSIVQGKTIAQGRQGAAQSALEQLQDTLAGLKAPSMDQMNSLASQGFMIGNGSGDETMLDETNKYLNEIAHLTREIKDKEAVASATYA